MRFKVEKLKAAQEEIYALEQNQQSMLESEYRKIEELGIEFVRIRHLKGKIYEIKSNELRSLFRYKAGQILLIGVVFVKKTQKTPKDKIRLAEKRLKTEV